MNYIQPKFCTVSNHLVINNPFKESLNPKKLNSILTAVNLAQQIAADKWNQTRKVRSLTSTVNINTDILAHWCNRSHRTLVNDLNRGLDRIADLMPPIIDYKLSSNLKKVTLTISPYWIHIKPPFTKLPLPLPYPDDTDSCVEWLYSHRFKADRPTHAYYRG